MKKREKVERCQKDVIVAIEDLATGISNDRTQNIKYTLKSYALPVSSVFGCTYKEAVESIYNTADAMKRLAEMDK